MKTGKTIIISGPSGSGKTTLYKKLLADKSFKDKLVKSVSVTTRPKRKGEKNGRDYFFVSRKKFLYKRRAGHFLESMKVFDNYYGTPKKNVMDLRKKGKSVLLCIDVKGARVVSRKDKSAIKIFVKTPSFSTLQKRLTKRGSEDKRVVAIRLATARRELKEAKHYSHVIVNDNLAKAYRKLKAIICKELDIAK